MLSQGGPFDQVTGIKEIARELRSRMKHFTSNLEELRDKVDDTEQCYQLLDKVREILLYLTTNPANIEIYFAQLSGYC